METLLRYRGRAVTGADVRFINELVAKHPTDSRRRLSVKLCEAWNWRQPNGFPRDMVCRGLMLELWRAGLIQLPAVRQRPPNPLSTRVRPLIPQVDCTPISASLRELGPLSFRQVRRTPEEAGFNSLLESYHYLGYTQPVGEQLKFVISCERGPVGLFAWSSAARHLVRVTATWVGRSRRDGRTFGFSPTTPGTLFCRGFTLSIWPRTY